MGFKIEKTIENDTELCISEVLFLAIILHTHKGIHTTIYILNSYFSYYFTYESRYYRSQTNSQDFLNFNRAASGLLEKIQTILLAPTGLSLGEPVNGVFEFTCTLNHHHPIVDVLLSRFFLCSLYILDF